MKMSLLTLVRNRLLTLNRTGVLNITGFYTIVKNVKNDYFRKQDWMWICEFRLENSTTKWGRGKVWCKNFLLF